ncbi:phage tail assembly protein [Bartonella apis]|uniref:phage tail assembly protein n=1 Tax=Bartonella apis TaxID=1686310 RepID=UPI00242BD627|nr:phage tail assembly protein [Bartonella apis]
MAEKIEPVTVKLSEPITVNGKTYTEITFTRKLKGKDMLAMDAVKGEMHQQYALLASLLDVPIPVISEINVDDLAAVMEAAAPFLGKFAQQAQKKPAENQPANSSTL